MSAFSRTSRLKTCAIFLACFFVFGLLCATGVSAQTTSALDVSGTGIQYGSYTGLSGTDIRVTIANIIRIALGLLGTIALLIILYAGFQLMTAAGAEDRVTKAKQTLMGAVIGLVIILLSFAIVSFIMNALVDSTTGGGGGGGGGGAGGGGGGFGGGGSGFRPTAIQPQGVVGKRDVVVAITFSSAPTGDVSNLRANILLEKEEGGSRTPVDYTPIVTNNVVQLVPDATCPAPRADRHCLDANSDFVVHIQAGLKNASSTDPLTVNCGFTAICSQDFSTGDGIGTTSPTVTISNPTNGQSVPVGEIVQIQALLGDEYGIGSVDYFSDGSFIASDGSVTSLGGGAFTSQTSWDTSGAIPGTSIVLGATATNIDGDSTNATGITVVPRAAHCFNGVIDFDEVGPDCGGADCGACTGSSCTVDAQCASGQCIAGQCVVVPKILDVQARNGAPGNIITVTGEDFGSGVGIVTFVGDINDDADDQDAEIARCSGSWNGERVFVVVPSGASTGPIRITTSAGKMDITNDVFGPVIPDFVVNDAERPGICGIDPVQAKAGQTLTVSGEGFGDVQGASRVEFAKAGADCLQTQAFAEGSDAGIVDPWSATSLQPMLPNLATGSNGQNYLVRVTSGSESSNTACMRLLPPSSGSRPRIDFVSPVSGSVGTYMTLFGGNFGAYGTVRFSSGAGIALGEIDFPAQCTIDFWNEDSVTVKVPDGFMTPSGTAIVLGDYQVTVVRNDGQESDAVSFTIDNTPFRPGLCRIEPDNGPVGTSVSLYGEGFGSVPFGDFETFVTAHPDAVLFNDVQPIDSLSLWNDGSIGSVVPNNAKTGPVVVRRFSGASFVESNAVNFQVSDCRQTGGDASCDAGQSCCGDGACKADCGETTNVGGFAWQFSTGPIPVFPVVLEDATCRIAKTASDETVTPSPNPYRNEQDICTDISSITLRFSLPMNPATFTASSVILERCGTADVLGTCEAVPSGTVGAPALAPIELGTQSKLTLPVAGFEGSTWYRLTVTDGVSSLAGGGRSAQPLDGDHDAKAGGSYVTQFKTGETSCIVSGVNVDPARGLIDASDGSLEYVSEPLSDRCIVLSCTGHTVSWSSSDTSKATVGASGVEKCTTIAVPVAETDPGPDIDIRAEIEGFHDIGKLKVDYANPRVVEYGPNNCTVACVNTLPYAVFNTEMADYGAGNVTAHARIQKCANESCLAFESGPDSVTVLYRPGVDGLGNRIGEPTLSFEHEGLAANTFYRVTIDGVVESTSAAPLTGLNYEDSAFSWIFRTRPDGNPCGPQSIDISPHQTTLRYIGERAVVTATPKTSPDACSETGQRLTANSFDWDWERGWNPASSPDVFDILPHFPLVLNRYTAPTAGCTSSCLASGSFPPYTPECGNGVRETPAEACESPGIGGCTERCLLTGNIVANGCGDGVVNPAFGEECDEGASDPDNAIAENGESKSGCTASCLFSGSVSGLSVCGNGSTGIGEACDDGNTTSGDGCSSACLREGSDQDVPVCGNGILETPYEQCDYVVEAGIVTRLVRLGGIVGPAELEAAGMTNANIPGFPCSDACLFVGNRVQGDEIGSCGNGVIEYVEGENCDAGEHNGSLGSGCSSDCRKTGEDIVLGAFCKDGIVKIDPVSGGGEDCDPSVGPSIPSPRQVVEGLNQCDAKNSCSASVIAGILGTGISGKGILNVECSCRADSDCTGFGSNLACGTGSCCYQRPVGPTIEPTGFNQCRNAAVTISFPVEMNAGSLVGNITVEQCGGTIAHRDSGNFLVRALRSVGNFFKSLVGLGASAEGDCTAITGTFTHATFSEGDVTKTESSFSPSTMFEASTTYRITVATGPGGVITANGIGYPASQVITKDFGTGTEICSFDVLQVEPADLLIQTSDEIDGFIARAMTDRGGLLEEIAPVVGVYDWSWEWATAAIGGGDTNLTLIPEAPTGPSASVQAVTGVNGKEQLIAQATINTDALNEPSTESDVLIGKADITIFLCENPWPSRDIMTGAWEPYIDPDTHFETYYCRDQSDGNLLPELLLTSREGDGNPGPVEGQSGFRADLLGFCVGTTDGSDQPKSCGSDADCSVGDRCRKKDAFFRFRPEARLNDAIGVRVAPNVNHLSPQRWYESQQFSGQTESIEVDGYHAIKDDRTIYVSAADKYGDPQLRSYVYVFGYNDGADSRTIEIFDQLIGNLSFNTNVVGASDVTNVCVDGVGEIILSTEEGVWACSTDLDCLSSVPNAASDVRCDADKDKIRRDMLRWEDLYVMTEELDAIRTSTGFYPRLESGSFIRGMTTSKWPSWSELGGAALADPINEFNQCENFGSICAISKRACSSNADCDQEGVGDVCRPKFEGATCFNNAAGIFLCAPGSRIYRYQAIGGISYELQAEFEYITHPWGGACADQTSVYTCESKIGCYFDTGSSSCKSRIKINPSCTGTFSGNACLLTGTACADDRDCDAGLPGDTCQPSGVKLFGSSVPGSEICGNGIVEATEVCEIGTTETLSCSSGGFKYQVCRNDCSGYDIVQDCPGAAFCGNGIIEKRSTIALSETCDDGAQNGEYGQCRTGAKGCQKYCVDIFKRVDFTSANVHDMCISNASCGPDQLCTDRWNFCGDGVKNGPESCDDGADNGDYGRCAWDCSGAGPRCGDLEVNGGEICDGNQVVSSGVCVADGTPVSDSSTVAGIAKACNGEADCGADETCAVCAPTLPIPPADPGGLPQTRTKSCQPASVGLPNACTFVSWSACKPSGACGNGVVEGNEQCDQGSANSITGACLPTCRTNVCNDGFVRQGVEQCDNGSANGTRCNPNYGLTCNYCKNDCTVETISGAFCGDGIIQTPPSGSENCDPGSLPAWCSKTYQNLADASSAKACFTDNACTTGICRNYPGGSEPSGNPCHSFSDCAALQYCAGGEGECIAFGNLCRPEPYSNTQDPASPWYLNGDCALCSNACSGQVVRSPYFCGDDIIQPQFGEQCEGDDGDEFASVAAGTYYGCRLDCHYDTLSGSCGDGRIQESRGEICDEVGKGCITETNPNPDLYLKVDMVFAIDVSGSMRDYITDIRDGIARFANEYRGTTHRFAVVTFGQAASITTLETGGHVVIGLTQDIDAFIGALDVAKAKVSGTRALEPMYQSTYEIMSTGGGAYTGIDWASDAQPYVVVVTDESPPDGYSTPDTLWVDESQVAGRAVNCAIGSCVGGGRIETFVITTEGNYDRRPKDALGNPVPPGVNADDWVEFTFGEKSERFIDIHTTDYSGELRTKTFANVCSIDAGLPIPAATESVDKTY